jgi:pimeloyl-ACP methyl ester carboxylesterase
MAVLQEYCGSRLFYQHSGSGHPILLLHSSGCTGGSWQRLVSELGANFTFYTPDLAGYGQSSCDYLGEESTLRDEAEFVAPLMWDVDEKFHLVGHSFGGAVALAAALAWPERIKTLTLYEPTAFSVLRDRSDEDRKQFDVIRRVADDMRQFIAESSNHRAMALFVDFWNGAGTWDQMPTSQQYDLSRLAKKMVYDFRALFDQTWNAEDFGRLRFPVAILKGDKSPPVVLRVADALANLIPQARLITAPNVGHMAPVTHPRVIAPIIMNHLQFPGARETHSDAQLAGHDDHATNPSISISERKRA